MSLEKLVQEAGRGLLRIRHAADNTVVADAAHGKKIVVKKLPVRTDRRGRVIAGPRVAMFLDDGSKDWYWKKVPGGLPVKAQYRTYSAVIVQKVPTRKAILSLLGG